MASLVLQKTKADAANEGSSGGTMKTRRWRREPHIHTPGLFKLIPQRKYCQLKNLSEKFHKAQNYPLSPPAHQHNRTALVTVLSSPFPGPTLRLAGFLAKHISVGPLLLQDRDLAVQEGDRRRGRGLNHK